MASRKGVIENEEGVALVGNGNRFAFTFAEIGRQGKQREVWGGYDHRPGQRWDIGYIMADVPTRRSPSCAECVSRR